MKDKEKDIKEFLDNIPDTFDILEEGIDIQIQKEYIEYSHSFDNGELTETETIMLGKILFLPTAQIDAKKKVLAMLAHLGTITAFRLIEKYYKHPDNEIKQWTALALQECKMFLESELMDEGKVFISSGLGGLKDKLRYYLLVLPLLNRTFTTEQKEIIKEEFNYVSKVLNCLIESNYISDRYIGFTVLVPMDVAVGTFIESGIEKCNKNGDNVLEHYYVTNQNIPDEAEIKEIIKIIRG